MFRNVVVIQHVMSGWFLIFGTFIHLAIYSFGGETNYIFIIEIVNRRGLNNIQ